MIFELFVGPLLLFTVLTVRDCTRWRNGEWIGFDNWQFNLVCALVCQILVETFVLARAWLLR